MKTSMASEPTTNQPESIAFQSAPAFESWLDNNAGLQVGVWLKLAKTGSGIASLTSDEAVGPPPAPSQGAQHNLTEHSRR